ncbi:heavy-metal-associated domain-containing protein [Nitrospira lenta]|uniref:Copper chaperone CopZ n=1 Tax=Nitrospira lenta TaxID=1436998 RepID=A0A330L8X9_9BACT|nr:cation transporter [Nitrospira lenta]SPP66316.1 Copper chaperone CopZ [Nitrospira lenta]
MDELTLKIAGMSCGHCVGQVTKALTRLDGVRVNSVKVGEAIVVYDPREIVPTEIIQAVNEAGYEAELVRRVA